MTTHTLINRELSWLDFNARVLQEAEDKHNPLGERFKFLGIFSNNKDEFFRVRMATLHRLIKHKKTSEADKEALEATIAQVHDAVSRQEDNFTAIYEALIEQANAQHIYMRHERSLTPVQQDFVQHFFIHKLRPFLYPLMLQDDMRFKHFKDNSIYLAVQMRDSSGQKKENMALIEIPTDSFERFVVLPSQPGCRDLIFLDDIIRFNLPLLFATLGFNSFSAYIIKFTREAELDIDNDVMKSFLKIMSESVKKRKKAPHVRFVYDKTMPDTLLEHVLKTFGIGSRDRIKAAGRYHNLKDLMAFPLQGEHLTYPKISPQPHPAFARAANKFEVLRKQDVLFYFPYHSFDDVNNWIWEAAIDPEVRAIKMTFYRVSRHSNLMLALINAARNGKKVTVFMELQARFDEEDNIYWTKRLQAEGVQIIPTIPGFKVHAKLMLIRRKERGQNVYYGNVSTGNFHESTAKVYADFNLLTSNADICSDINKVFQLFTSKFVHPQFSRMLVAPFSIRSFVNKRIDKEIAQAKAGKEAWMVLKINNLVDKKIIEKLYEAADAGVKIKLIARGICVLRQHVVHPNIDAFGVVDRFLEHSRVFIFANGGRSKYYISSADLMPRNLDHRIEVVCPVLDKRHKKTIQDIIDMQLKDNVKARLLQGDNINTYRRTADDEPHRSQQEIYEYFFGEKTKKKKRHSS